MKKIKLPYVSIMLMLIYLVGGSIIISVKMPAGPANLHWGLWIIGYLGYLYLIAATIYYAVKGN